jgi:cysteine-rich repeat protein
LELPGCGNLIVEVGEECDDGNDANDDACLPNCKLPATKGVFAGAAHTCAFTQLDIIKCWGGNASGQLGLGNTSNIGDDETPSSTPNIFLGDTIVSLRMGEAHSCAMTQQGGVQCWGSDSFGQLGRPNSLANFGDSAGESPADLANIAQLGFVSDLAVGGNHTCALGNGLFCWGRNGDGQLGIGNAADLDTPSVPVQFGAQFNVLHIAAGDNHTCAAGNDPNNAALFVQCWGENSDGQLGLGDQNDRTTPAPIPPAVLNNVARLSLGRAHSCALLDDGSVRCWGGNSFGQLGYGDQINRNSPPAEVVNLEGQILVFNPISDPIRLATGGFHTCALLDDGGVKCWGRGSEGQLGLSGASNQLTPTTTVILGRPATQITAGGNHTCAVLDDGRVICWGQANSGQLGYGSPNNVGDNEAPVSAGQVSIF